MRAVSWSRRDFALLLLVTATSLSNYAPLLSVVPLWAASGGLAGTGVGATTGVMMGATAATQLAMGPLFRLLTLRQMLTTGALIMAVATPLYALSPALGPVLAVSAVRGVGFALVVVAGSALVAEIVPGRRLARGTAIYGLAAGLPNVVALPAGVWIAQEWGFGPVFFAAGALALTAVPLAWVMRAGNERARPRTAARRTSVRALRPLARPAVVFFTTTMALGGVTTFLPLAVSDAATASTALFALSLCMILGRMGAGTVGDWLEPGRLLLPATVVSAVGMAGLTIASAAGGGGAGDARAALIGVVGAGLFGLGFGVVQNDSLILILRRAGRGAHGTASAVWNFAYDGGTGAGAVLLGVAVTAGGYPWAFGVAAGVIALATGVAGRGRR